jgi:hypothetical protein
MFFPTWGFTPIEHKESEMLRNVGSALNLVLDVTGGVDYSLLPPFTNATVTGDNSFAEATVVLTEEERSKYGFEAPLPA